VQAPFAVREISVAAIAGGKRHEISFAGDPRGAAPTTVAATLLVPDGSEKCAGVLWVHWLGEPATTNRSEFLDEASALAARGVVSLLVDTMWAKPHWYRNRMLAEDFSNYVRQVVELRRALDLLASRPEVDAARLALVGHDYGAMHGIIAAAFDARVRTCVLIAATPSFNDWAFYVEKPADLEAYLQQMAPLDLLDYAHGLASRPVLLQFAREDFYVPIPRAEKLFQALAEPRRMEIYDGAGHDMAAPAAIRADRTAWLVERLGLP
jgi:pimeloyl-ACP methyl ester carboxylesterase